MGLLALLHRRVDRSLRRHLALASVSPLPDPRVCRRCGLLVWEVNGELRHRHGDVECVLEDIPR